MEIVAAAYGWQGEDWDGFYPEDIPADWRLDYYANEFFAVAVPHRQWAQAADSELMSWLEQVSADFRFFWELPPGSADGERLQRLRRDAAFATHWGGVFELPSAVPSRAHASPEAVAVLPLTRTLALPALRDAMQRAAGDEKRTLLVVVYAGAAASLRQARDLAQLLAGG